MKNLTDYQRSFLLLNFFKNERYAGWERIATKLLEKGKCTVVGDRCIWVGGIGNFIKTEEAEDAVGCLLYTFDLDCFLTSEWYKEVRNNYVATLASKKREIEQEYEVINQLQKQLLCLTEQ